MSRLYLPYPPGITEGVFIADMLLEAGNTDKSSDNSCKTVCQ